ncbi:hypothetical protein AVEN_66432-1 [Araneus ventricosus]|uniref:Uncharacterized protein n=1 Tax=Araneus ventricosus TaxID=182803 RepID=A0A4Y2EIP1_ARAVE|nr:hypothetical protein AVEN_66432-1 [Araneus ventricosus]
MIQGFEKRVHKEEIPPRCLCVRCHLKDNRQDINKGIQGGHIMAITHVSPVIKVKSMDRMHVTSHPPTPDLPAAAIGQS